MSGAGGKRSEWSVVVLGSGGIGCDIRRGSPSLLLRVDTSRALIDAGDGTLRQLAPRNPRVVDLIVITSLTTDRLAGLPAILDQAPYRGRRRIPVLIGPPGIKRTVDGMRSFMSADAKVRDIIEIDDAVELPVMEATLRVAAVDETPSGCVLGLRLSEPDIQGRFQYELAERLGVHPGPEFARLQRGETIRGVRREQVLGPARPGRRLSILGPCRPTARAQEQVANSRLLLAVTPYTEEKQDLAAETGVMTGVEAALLAKTAKAEGVALLHVLLMPRMQYARREAAQFHRRVYLPNDGGEFSIPMPDNGPVALRSGKAPDTAPQATLTQEKDRPARPRGAGRR
jgi:ribonuclease Z